MSTPDELRAAELRAQEADRRFQIYEREQDAIGESERGWQAIPFLIVDSIAAGAVIGLRFALGATLCFFAIYAASSFPLAAAAVLAGVPIITLLIIAAVLTMGPFRADRLQHPRLVVNGSLFLWALGTLIFSLVVIAMASP